MQSLLLLTVWALVAFVLPAEILENNLWSSKVADHPLKTEYTIALVMICNMIRLSLLALRLFFKKKSQPEQSRLLYTH